MFSIDNFSRSLTVLAMGMALTLTACNRGEPESVTADREAALANVESMAEQHADDTVEPSDAALVEPSRPVISERLAYAEVGDQLVYGHFAFPEDMVEPLPGLIIIHEWWGLNDNVRAMADRFAGEGYIVLAVDLYGGKTAANPGEAEVLMQEVAENPGPAEENIRRAFDFLRNTGGAPAIGSLGWCFGGGWSLNAAIMLEDQLDAAVIYYGQVTVDPEKLQAVEAPVLGLFGEADEGIPLSLVRGFEAAMESLGKEYTIHVYPGAGHAFANPTGVNYDRKAAEDAWQKSLDFLALHLKGN